MHIRHGLQRVLGSTLCKGRTLMQDKGWNMHGQDGTTTGKAVCDYNATVSLPTSRTYSLLPVCNLVSVTQIQSLATF